MDKVAKKLCSCGKEQKSTAVAADIGKSSIKIIDPVGTEVYRPRESERGERGGRRCEYGGRAYEK